MPAKKTPAPKPKKETTSCMVLKAGDGKISKGERKGNSDLYFARKDMVEFPPDVAKALEARGYVEIMDD